MGNLEFVNFSPFDSTVNSQEPITILKNRRNIFVRKHLRFSLHILKKVFPNVFLRLKAQNFAILGNFVFLMFPKQILSLMFRLINLKILPF